jgi:tRNA(Ile)-lysidine synthase
MRAERRAGVTRRFSAAALRKMLETQVPVTAAGLLVAISGGGDSSCLLTALAQLGVPPLRNLRVRAVHVDHGLQPAAASFRAACAALCRHLDVPLTILEVSVAAGAGASIEAAARLARYAGIARELRPGECLLTAHHAGDQAQTLLLQLLRGAGPQGLAGMPLCRSFGAGWHVRPLLRTAQHELLAYGASQGVRAQSDPMNADLRFDRVYLRTQVWPLLAARWPGCEAALSRSARHLADSQQLLERSADQLLPALRDGDALSVSRLRLLDDLQRRNVVRHWIATQGAALPSLARLSEALRQMIDAEADHLPVIAWDVHALRRYRDRLFLTDAAPPCLPERCAWTWHQGSSVALGAGLGTLHCSPQRGGLDAPRLPAVLEIRRRRGGETLKPHPRARTQSVQHLCQSMGILPWMRDALPMIYAGEQLIAVGDLWHDARWCVPRGAPGWVCAWRDPPVLA